MKKKVVAIITAAGKGSRLKGEVQKQFRNIAGKPVLARTLEVFEGCGVIDEIIITVPAGAEKYCREKIVKACGFSKVKAVIKGGKDRQESVFNALNGLRNCSIAVIHDGVRPFVSGRIIRESVGAARKYGASVVAVPLSDTIKKIDCRGMVVNTLERKNIWRMQTPQSFRYGLIMKAHRDAKAAGAGLNDDSLAVEMAGKRVKVVNGSSVNIKLTVPEDLFLAEKIAGARETRFGIGYDVHVLEPGRKLVLGGIRIPFGLGLKSHSDGDVLIHSICDALLGAIGEKDIGTHFPDTDIKYKGIPSTAILKKVTGMVKKAGYEVNNVDSMIIAQAPRLSGYMDRMKTSLSKILGVGSGAVGIKATTNEGMGLIGEGKGMAAYSVVSVIPIPRKPSYAPSELRSGQG